MSALAALQRALSAAIEEGRDEPAIGRLRGGERDARLRLHRGAVHARREAALAATFARVGRLVGEASFAALAARYASAHAPRSGDLGLYGEGFPAFLGEDVEAREFAGLADAANLDWACHESLHAADAPPLDAAALAAVPEALRARVRLTVHPSLRLLDAPCVLVHRVGYEVRVREVEVAERRLLRALIGGATLEEAAEALGEEAAAFLAPALARLARDQAIAGFLIAADRA